MRFRKGVSTIVATTLIILLTAISAVLIAQFVIPFTNKSLTKGTECMPVEDYYSFDDRLGYNYYVDEEVAPNTNFMTKNVYVSIRAKNDAEVAKKVQGFSISVTGTGNSISVQAKPTEFGSGLNVWTGTYVHGGLYIPQPGETLTYRFRYSLLPYTEGDRNANMKVDVYPILVGGRVCEGKSPSLRLPYGSGKVG